jgi:hypothetical protein
MQQFVLNYFKEEESYIEDEFGRKLCTQTIMLEMDFDNAVYIYTGVCGGDFDVNYAELSNVGFRGGDTDTSPASSIHIKGDTIDMVFINEKIAQDHQDKIRELALKYDA